MGMIMSRSMRWNKDKTMTETSSTLINIKSSPNAHLVVGDILREDEREKHLAGSVTQQLLLIVPKQNFYTAPWLLVSFSVHHGFH